MSTSKKLIIFLFFQNTFFLFLPFKDISLRPELSSSSHLRIHVGVAWPLRRRSSSCSRRIFFVSSIGLYNCACFGIILPNFNIFAFFIHILYVSANICLICHISWYKCFSNTTFPNLSLKWTITVFFSLLYLFSMFLTQCLCIWLIGPSPAQRPSGPVGCHHSTVRDQTLFAHTAFFVVVEFVCLFVSFHVSLPRNWKSGFFFFFTVWPWCSRTKLLCTMLPTKGLKETSWLLYNFVWPAGTMAQAAVVQGHWQGMVCHSETPWTSVSSELGSRWQDNYTCKVSMSYFNPSFFPLLLQKKKKKKMLLFCVRLSQHFC